MHIVCDKGLRASSPREIIMPLVPNLLEIQLKALVKTELSPEEANAEFARIITDYIKTAQVTVTGSGTGGNGGGPIATIVTGTGTIQ